MIRRFSTWTAFVASLVLATVAMQAMRLEGTRRFFEAERPEDVYYLPPPDWLRVMDMGYHDATSDVIWSIALVYAGDGIRQGMGARYVIGYARAMTTLDPTWTRPYRWAPIAAAYQVVPPPIELMEDAGRFVASGVDRFPTNGQVAWAAGSYFAYELAPRYPPGSQERANARKTGLRYMISAARHGAGPAWLALSNASSMTQMGNLELAAAHLQEMLGFTTDPVVRAEIVRRLEALGAAARSAAADDIDALEARRREEYPYLPTGLYELVAPPLLRDP